MERERGEVSFEIEDGVGRVEILRVELEENIYELSNIHESFSA